MGKRDPRIDTYIAKAAPFAQPILEHFRDVVHAAVPKVEETIIGKVHDLVARLEKEK